MRPRSRRFYLRNDVPAKDASREVLLCGHPFGRYVPAPISTRSPETVTDTSFRGPAAGRGSAPGIRTPESPGGCGGCLWSELCGGCRAPGVCRIGKCPGKGPALLDAVMTPGELEDRLLSRSFRATDCLFLRSLCRPRRRAGGCRGRGASSDGAAHRIEQCASSAVFSMRRRSACRECSVLSPCRKIASRS